MTITTYQLPLSVMEGVWLLRQLRAAKASMSAELMYLEERIKSGADGMLSDTYRTVDGDIAICDTIIRKLWTAVHA